MLRAFSLLLGVGVLVFTISCVELGAEELHKNAFSGKATVFVRGEENVKAEVKLHELSADRSRSLPSSERIKLNCGGGKNESNFAYYYYSTPPAPITEDLSAELMVHSNKAGVQLLARIVFPKVRNPKQLDEPLTSVVLLDSYKAPAGGWQKLLLKRPLEILQNQKQALRLQMRQDVDVSDAYIDRLIVNLYTGPGEVEVFLDNLEIGPVKANAAPPPPVNPKQPGKAVSQEKQPRPENGLEVDFQRRRLTVAGKQAFPRFIRYNGMPLQLLREAGFNSLYVPLDTPIETIEDAIDNYQFWVIPHVPPVSEGASEKLNSPLMARDADALSAALRKFISRDGVLFWDFGPVRSEDYKRVARTVEAIRAVDAKRPIGGDVWDGFGKFSIPLQLIGTHRDPLMTTLELDRYSEWLAQRRILTSGSQFMWTWIQTHIPEWQVKLLYGKDSNEPVTDPLGPQPEQIRLLTYLAAASGCKGLGFWSDRFMADPRHGRERVLQMMILNQELEMIEELLNAVTGEIRWVKTSHPSVKVAILRTTGKGVLALPIWLGGGAQYVPPQGAVQGLTFTIPLVPDGAEPWEITPVRVQSLQSELRQTPEGLQITIPEFDMTAAIVFTNDNAPDGLIAKWQKHTKRVGRFAATWMCELAEDQLHKVVRTHDQLVTLTTPIDQAEMLLKRAERELMTAKRELVANNNEAAYFDAVRSLRPLRVLMRAYWERATKNLDYPAASPYAVSYYTLPKHWELAQKFRNASIGANALNDGDFERAGRGAAGSASVSDLPGWTVQEVALDDVVMRATIVSSAVAQEPPPPPRPPSKNPYLATSLEKRGDLPPPATPTLADRVLKLSVTPKPITLGKDEKAPPEPQALERVFLCVNSPPVRLTPGSWVRISGWVKITENVRASADGVMLYDTAAGEAFAVRLTTALKWKQFHMYRQVPPSGDIRVRLALTGFGTAYFDDIRIEPLVGVEASRPKEELLPKPIAPKERQ